MLYVLPVRYYATQYVLTHFGFVWRLIASIPFLRQYADRFVIEAVAQQLQFPLPLSTAAPYTTLDSFTDHSYFNRILPPKPPTSQLPDSQDVANLLFKRPAAAGYQQDDYSNFLFLSFAQWFVDQFLMTDPTDPVKQTSNNTINLCTVYGDTADVERLLRSPTGGRLKSQRIRGDEFPPFINDESKPVLLSAALEKAITQALGASSRKVDWTRLFAIGHVRMNLTPGCLCFALLFFREHNRVADLLRHAHPTWDDEQLFQTAKNVCVVEVMKIGVIDYVINHIAWKLQYPLRFHPEVLFNTQWCYNNQRIFIEFDHLYRWHAFVPNTVAINGAPVPLAASDSVSEQLLWNTELLIDGRATLSSLINDMSNAPAGRFAPINTHPVLARVEKATIDAGRAAQLASFNDYRERWGLWRYRSIDELSSNTTIRQRLRQLYNNNVDAVEFYVGLMCEDRGHYGNSIFPPLLATIVGAEAFRGVFGNPLLAPAVYNAATFSQVGLDVIDGTSLRALVARNVAPASRRAEHRVSFELPGRRGAAADR